MAAEEETANTKVCSSCRVDKPLQYFFNDKAKFDGKASTCKICSRARSKKWKENNSFPAKMTGTKTCRICITTKNITDFYRNNKAKDGRTSICSNCLKERMKQWESTHKYTKVRNHRYKYRYGISLEEYEKMLKAQNYICANTGCKEKADDQFYGTLSVDHDHKCCNDRIKTCGKCIRGLLCNSCNKTLGLMKEDKIRMSGLINYLDEYEETK